MKYEWVSFEKLEENRNGYFVTYSLVWRDRLPAVLVVSFYEYRSATEIAETLEDEFRIWISRYPTPLMVMFSREMGEFTEKLEQVRNNEYILGYPVNGKSITGHIWTPHWCQAIKFSIAFYNDFFK